MDFKTANVNVVLCNLHKMYVDAYVALFTIVCISFAYIYVYICHFMHHDLI